MDVEHAIVKKNDFTLKNFDLACFRRSRSIDKDADYLPLSSVEVIHGSMCRLSGSYYPLGSITI